MRCINCGTQLPPTAKVCPNCGTPTTSLQSGSGASYYPPTIPADPYNKPATAYGTTGYDPYSIPNPYTAPNPYTTGQTPPPPPSVLPTTSPPALPPAPTPPPQKTRRNNIALIAIIGVLILLLIGGGVLAYRNAVSQTGNQPGTTPTTTNNTPAPSTAQNPYPPHTGTLIMDDPMNDNSKGFKWDEATIGGTAHCGFVNGAYHLTTGKNEGLSCNPEAPQLSLTNFAFEVKVSIVKGIGAGIVFRDDQPNSTYYLFEIDTLGDYGIFSYDGKTYKPLTSNFNANAAIMKGLNQPNLLAVVAQGNKFSFYVNNQYIDTKTDSTYALGQIGVYAVSSATDTADATASNARVWKI